MDETFLPEDLSQLSDEDLAALGTKISERAEEIAESGSLDDASIDEIEGLAEAADAVNAEAAHREEVTAAKAERLASAISKFRPESDVLDDVTAEGGDEEEAPEDEEPAEDAEDEDAEQETAPVAVAASTERKVPSSGSLTILKSKRPAALAAKAAPADARPRFQATAFTPDKQNGTDFASVSELATAIATKRMSMGVVPAGTRDNIVIASGAKTGIDTVLGNDAMENFATLQGVRHEHQAIVASGAVCAPQTPLYDFFRLAEPQNPVEQALNVVQAPRGGIRFITPPDYRDARAAVGGVTYAQEAAGYVGSLPDAGPTANKLIHRVDCPDVQEVMLDAVYWSVRWGNLQYRTFPEQVEAFMEDLAVAFATRKEQKHLDYIDSKSTPTSSVSPYGASRGLLFDWTREAVAYRKRNGMKRGSTLQVLAPDWALDLVKADIVNDANNGLSYLALPDSVVEGALRDRGLDVTWFNDSTTALAGTQTFSQLQSAGTLNAWPTTVVSYMFAPGTFVRLDGGTLDVGLVRDSVLNRTNDLELFFEEWLATVMLGIESIKLTATVCPNGTAAALSTPFTCP